MEDKNVIKSPSYGDLFIIEQTHNFFRPGVIISDTSNSEDNLMVVFASRVEDIEFTSNYDIPVEIEGHESMLRCRYITTISNRQLVRFIRTITEDESRRLQIGLRSVLGLSEPAVDVVMYEHIYDADDYNRLKLKYERLKEHFCYVLGNYTCSSCGHRFETNKQLISNLPLKKRDKGVLLENGIVFVFELKDLSYDQLKAMSGERFENITSVLNRCGIKLRGSYSSDMIEDIER